MDIASADRLPDLQRFGVGLIDLGAAAPARAIGVVRANPHVRWIALIGRSSSYDEARMLIEEYCFDFHSAPLDDARLEVSLERAYELACLDTGAQDTEPDWEAGGARMLGASKPAVELARMILRAASSDVPVLLQGESGTEKRLAALTLHRQSKRAGRPFITLDCGGLPTHLARSELFGREPGESQGTSELKLGRLEVADGGSLLLEDVDDLGPELQLELLRVLQEGIFRRVGGTRPIRVDVRILATTTLDLGQAVEYGLFREDLYDRLSLLHITVPPLRERGADAIRLARFFLKRHGRGQLRGFTRSAVEAMLRYRWPGNVHELMYRVQHAATVAKGRLVKAEDLGLPDSTAPTDRQPTLAEARAQAEREAIEEALRQSAHNVARAARQLAIGRVTLYRLIEKHGISLQRRYYFDRRIETNR